CKKCLTRHIRKFVFNCEYFFVYFRRGFSGGELATSNPCYRGDQTKGRNEPGEVRDSEGAIARTRGAYAALNLIGAVAGSDGLVRVGLGGCAGRSRFDP